MLTLPDAIISVLAPFATLFTNPTWQKQLSRKSMGYWVTGMLRSRQVERCLSMELRITSSLRMQAVRASFFGLPAASNRW